jgi:hypothetical protein
VESKEPVLFGVIKALGAPEHLTEEEARRYNVEPDSVRRYIGWCDKTGRLLFEGDQFRNADDGIEIIGVEE